MLDKFVSENANHILAGVISALLGALAVWLCTRLYRTFRRLQALQTDFEHLEKERARLAEQNDVLEKACDTMEDRFSRERSTHLLVRERFTNLRETYLALKQRAGSEKVLELERQLQFARERVGQLEQTLDARRNEGSDPAAVRQLALLENALRDARLGSETLLKEQAELSNQIESATNERDLARVALARLEEETNERSRLDGKLWLRPPTGDIPRFRPRRERHATIISVLNLKGGVGKTTVTANLAATLARPDAPVLVVDLDYQRSLSMLLVSDQERRYLHRAGDSVQHFLAGSKHSLADLTSKVKNLQPDLPNCSILTNSVSSEGNEPSESLEEVENRLLAEWLFNRNRPDPRFFLRESLHEPGLDYGYVLLDCPPRLTTACVNALAASDFVLIPVVPDTVSTRAVENLLRTLHEFRTGFLSELAVLGVLPSMVKLVNGEPTRQQADALIELKAVLPALWGSPVPILKSPVKHDSEFGKSAAEMNTSGKIRLAIRDGEIEQMFRALAKEIEREIDRHASQRTPAIPPKPGARARSGR